MKVLDPDLAGTLSSVPVHFDFIIDDAVAGGVA